LQRAGSEPLHPGLANADRWFHADGGKVPQPGYHADGFNSKNNKPYEKVSCFVRCGNECGEWYQYFS